MQQNQLTYGLAVAHDVAIQAAWDAWVKHLWKLFSFFVTGSGRAIFAFPVLRRAGRRGTPWQLAAAGPTAGECGIVSVCGRRYHGGVPANRERATT